MSNDISLGGGGGGVKMQMLFERVGILCLPSCHKNRK